MEPFNLNICLLSSTPVGGFKSFVDNISSLLVKNGCRVTILYIKGKESVNNGTNIEIFNIFDNLEDSISGLFFHLIKCLDIILFRINPFNNNRDCTLKHNVLQSQLYAAECVKKCKLHLDLTQFDCVISTEEILCNYFLANNIKAIRKIGYIHPDYQQAHFNRIIDSIFLKKLELICAVSKANAETLLYTFPKFKKRIIGIPNPIDIETILTKSCLSQDFSWNDDILNLITVCRLDNSSKALDRLMIIAAKLKEARDSYHWRIVGEGPYRKQMETFISNNDLCDNIELFGYLENPLPLVKKSDLFVLQSYYEGYPMSVCEALIVGTPVLITDYPSSSEQIENNVDGFIVENNSEAIFDRLHYIVNHRSVLDSIKNNLKQKDLNRFNTINLFMKAIKGETNVEQD